MKSMFRYGRYAVIILIFIVFNFMLLFSLREDKVVKGELKPKIVLISHIKSNPYWQYVKLGAEAAAKKRNAIIDFQGPDSPSVEEGIKYIKMAYAAKVSGIITFVQDEVQYKPALDKVADIQIPIVTVDADADKSKRYAYVGTDNNYAGTIGAMQMIDTVGVEGDVGIIMGGRSVKNQIERVNGFQEYIHKNSHLNIVEVESSDSYLLEAELAAKKIIMNDYGIKALFCTSALDGEGAAKAVVSLHLEGKIKIICFDNLEETKGYIENGIINTVILQEPYDMGYKAVNIVMDNLEGKETKGIFLTDIKVVKKDNLQEQLKKLGESDNEK